MEKNQNYFAAWEGLFIQYRPYLISFTFRMTGSLTEAEDLVQDTFLECASVNPATITNPKSWLTKVCSNKSLDLMKSAMKKRESYHGVWLPDAVPESFQFWGNLKESDSPDKNIVNTESLSTSFLLMMQKLSPEERVVYLLTDIFDYSFKEISDFMNKSEDACKKIAQRARKAFENHKRFLPYSRESQDVIGRFFEVAKNGDARMLETFLADGSEFWADGGGKISVASKYVITEKERMAKFIAALWSSRVFAGENVKQELKEVNYRPGLVISVMGENGKWHFDTIISFELENEKIERIYVQRNPDKLEALLNL